MFQDHQLFPQRDVGGNVAFGLRMRGTGRGEADRRVAELEVNSKGPRDMVSEADVAVEELIKDRLAAAFPTDAFLGEESGYAEIADYNRSPTATHWFEKALG